MKLCTTVLVLLLLLVHPSKGSSFPFDTLTNNETTTYRDKHKITSLPGLADMPTNFNMYTGHLNIGYDDYLISSKYGGLFYW